jgi:hypothetical protein
VADPGAPILDGGPQLSDAAGLVGDGDGGAPYVDPGCAPTTKIPGPRECDPYSTAASCGPGGECIPHITYTDGCQAEVIGTVCTVAGPGVQGDDCSVDNCAAGYVCVSGGAGFQCARLCTIQGIKDDCPPGLICAPLDVDGFFVCG